MKAKNILKSFIFWIPFLTLLTVSLFIMYHARYITETYAHHFERQILWFGIGFFLIFIFQLFSTQKLFSISLFLYLINLLLLILVLIIGTNVNGSKAWIDLKYFSFQPSELMKLSLALFLAHVCTRKKFANWKEEIIFLFFVFLIVLIPSILVFLEPDTGAILFYFLITFVCLWNSPLRKRWFFLIFTILLSTLGTFFYLYLFQKDLLISFIGTSFFYRVDRLLNIGSGMQIENALIAIGSAPFIQFHLRETGIYIPEAPTDFVFALCSNVFGIFGNLILIFSFFLIDCYLIHYVKNIKNSSKKIFSYAFLSIFITSQFISIAMNLGLFPIIGIPLPFVSYGGSSTIVLFFFLAIIFSKKRKKNKSMKILTIL